jgi:inosine-uridine nucleoside N-ribohydrolase
VLAKVTHYPIYALLFLKEIKNHPDDMTHLSVGVKTNLALLIKMDLSFQLIGP